MRTKTFTVTVDFTVSAKSMKGAEDEVFQFVSVAMDTPNDHQWTLLSFELKDPFQGLNLDPDF